MTIFTDSGNNQSDVAGTQFRGDEVRRGGKAGRLPGLVGAVVRFFSKPWPRNILRITVTAAVVYFVNRSVSGSDIVRLFREVRTAPLVAAVLLGAVSFLLQTLRWQLILKSNTLPCSFVIALKTMLRGSLLAFITPGRVGELFRALHLDRQRRLTTITAVAEERMFAVAATVVAGIICLALQTVFYQAAPFVPVAVASGLFCAVLIFAGAVIGLKLPLLTWRATGVFAFNGPVIAYVRHLRTLPHMQLSVLSAGAHLLLLVQTALLFHMFGCSGFIQELLIAGQAFTFMLLLPFFIANIGLREYAFTLFLGRSTSLHLASSQLPGIALGVGTLILIINIIIPAVLGLVWLYTEKKSVPGPYAVVHDEEAAVASVNQELHGNAR